MVQYGLNIGYLSSPSGQYGYSGVVRTRKWTGAREKNGNPLPYYNDVYSVTWSPEPGYARRTSFSIDIYGEEEAWRLAIDLRKRMERENCGQEINYRKPKREARKKKSISNSQKSRDQQSSSSSS